jgi:hypothetical protein
VTTRGQRRGQRRPCRPRHPREHHQLARDLDLEDHLPAQLLVDTPDRTDGGLGEGPAVPQPAGRAEGEHRHVQVAGDADQEAQVGAAGLLAQPGEHRPALQCVPGVPEVQAGLEQPVALRTLSTGILS